MSSSFNQLIIIIVGDERPDIQQIGILNFATIVHNSYRAGQLSEIAFEKYVRMYFELFIGQLHFTLIH